MNFEQLKLIISYGSVDNMLPDSGMQNSADCSNNQRTLTTLAPGNRDHARSAVRQKWMLRLQENSDFPIPLIIYESFSFKKTDVRRAQHGVDR